jgi:fucose 4-O-acetylase-like acetyltransferase
MKTKIKLDHIVLLRSLAIILVVFAHATRSAGSANLHMYSPAITPCWEVALKNYIYSFHMPLFFWISGYVFYYSSIGTDSVSNLATQLLKKVKRLIIPMYSTAFLILLPTIILFGHINGSILNQIKLFILGNDIDHLWYLKTLFMIFMISLPLKGFLSRNNKSCILASLIWYALYHFHPPIIWSAVKYYPFVFVGFIFRKYESKLNKVSFKFWFTTFWLLHLSALVSKKIFAISTSFEAVIWYLSAIFGIFFIYFLVNFLIAPLRESNCWSYIRKIDETSYSIYLFHVTFLYIVLFLVAILDIQSHIVRVFFSFLLGLLIPINIHYLFSNSYKLSFLFGISPKNHIIKRSIGLAEARR